MLSSAAIAGMGVALPPRYLTEDELARGQLAPVSGGSMPTEFSYYSVQPEAKRTSAAALTFQSWLLGQVSGAQPAT
ncbi:hypothetical protein GCM10011415_34650 [Salipiger pallidus]|uniref:LysR substrate-binding domain-containing protein n=1 Tax=Salipiger pallidus TaxID=1775170 RepID=A0A8J2ZN15_9RHOB|nr:LysR substrate-binding domain-containing protein [Salipiger pallidus]GGG82062.1 hypothetical protein GCM10011415_34650 [Salipiger pallidus]